MPGRRGAIRAGMHAGLAGVAAVLAWAAPASANPVFLSPIDVSDAGGDAFEQQLAVDQSGNEHHTWTRWDGSNTRIQYRLRDQAGNFDPVQTVSDPGQNASQPAMDVDDDGNVVAVWIEAQGSHVRVPAAERPAGGSFGSVQTVSAAGQNADRPRVSIDSAGKAVAVWVQYVSRRRTDRSRPPCAPREIASDGPDHVRGGPRRVRSADRQRADRRRQRHCDLEPLRRHEPCASRAPGGGT